MIIRSNFKERGMAVCKDLACFARVLAERLTLNVGHVASRVLSASKVGRRSPTAPCKSKARSGKTKLVRTFLRA